MREIRLDVFLAIFSFARELIFIFYSVWPGLKMYVTSHRIARGKITQQNATIVHRIGSKIHLKERLKARFNA